MTVLVLAAAVATIASSYPVVFLGKSFVSPNMGTVLLYEQFPTVPGYSDATDGEVMGADIGTRMQFFNTGATPIPDLSFGVAGTNKKRVLIRFDYGNRIWFFKAG